MSEAVQVASLTKQRTINQGGACPRVSKSGKVWESSQKSVFSDFESDAFNHSATLPTACLRQLNGHFQIGHPIIPAA
ncbi:MAG: hypothetical protein WCS42_17915, partial [Verrucomicrobiota bacterium]